jgi:hypothetical protein
MEKPRLTLNLTQVTTQAAANAAQHDSYATTPATLLASLHEDLRRFEAGEPISLMASFVGTFNQFSKCETGTAAFKALVDALPGCFAAMSDAITNHNPAAVGNFMVQPRHGLAHLLLHCRLRHIPIDEAAVREALSQWDAIVHGQPPSTAQERNALAKTLIQGLLIPLLNSMQ